VKENRLCLALDVDTKDEALRLINQLSAYIGLFKIGLQLFCNEGPSIVQEAIAQGADVFLDLKLHDIPNTVANTSRVLANYDIKMFNVHAMGGFQMMKETA